MKIFGMVFALHVALICILFSIQGCRSTPAPRAAETAVPSDEPAVVEPVSENWTNAPSSSLQPTPSNSSYASTSPMSAPPLSGLSPAERARQSPTRPDDPGAFISTNTPSAIAPPPPEPASYVVRAGDSFWKIARAHNTTTAELQRLNSGIRADALRPGMMLKIPGTVRPGGAASTAPANPMVGVSSTAATATYIVRSGDSLSKIAARNGTTVSALREMNGLRSDTIQIGQELKIPGKPAGGTTPAPSASLLPPPAVASSGDQVTVTVERGDTLGEIARKFGVTVADLMAANNITDATRVRAGQTLVIPGFQPVGAGTLPRPAPARSNPTNTPADQTPPPFEESPMEVDAPPVIPTSPAPARPREFDVPDAGDEAPPVQPLDEPMPAP